MDRRRAGWLWGMQALSGLLLLVLLGSHMVAQHFVAEGGLRTYAQVVAYLRNPWVQVLEALFLVVVLVHAMLGVRAIVLDLGLSPRAQRGVEGVLALLGLIALGYGVGLIVSLGGLG